MPLAEKPTRNIRNIYEICDRNKYDERKQYSDSFLIKS